MTLSVTDYLNQLRQHLTAETDLSSTAVDEVISEHRDLLTELGEAGADLAAELGTPVIYAESAAAEFHTENLGREKQPQGTLLGIPYDFRGAGRPGNRQRIWDPQDPHIFQPHLLGIGWSINLGAVAVKLGLIRPDDIDADVIVAIPTPVMATARAVPSVLAIANALILATSWRELPKAVPMNYTISGTPRGGRYPRNTALALPAIGAGFAVAPYLPSITEDREDSLLTAAIGSLLGASVLGSTAAVVADARGDDHPGRLVLAALGLGVVASAGVLIGPLTVGLRRVWHREGVR